MVVVYDAATTTEIGRITADSPFTDVDVSVDGRYVLAHTHLEVFLFDTLSRTSSRLPIPPAPAGGPDELDRGIPGYAQVLFRPGGSDEILVVTGDGMMTMWNRAESTRARCGPPEGTCRLRLPHRVGYRPRRIVLDGSLTRGRRQKTTARCSLVVFWDIDRGEAVRSVTLENPGVRIEATAASPDGEFLVGHEPAGRLFVWNGMGDSWATPPCGRTTRSGSPSNRTARRRWRSDFRWGHRPPRRRR